MLVLIPHPSETQKLIRVQKQLAADNFCAGTTLIREMPLWIPLPGRPETPAELKGRLTGVTICTPQTDGKTVFCRVQIFLADGMLESTLTLCRVLHEGDSVQKSSAEESLFPLRLRVFRLGRYVRLGKNSACVEGAVWVKLAQITSPQSLGQVPSARS